MARWTVVFGALPVLACAAAVVPLEPAPAQDADRAGPIVEQAIAWQGGRERLAKIRYVQIKQMQITVHGAQAGEANQIEIKGLLFDRGVDGGPERLRFHLTSAAGSRTQGFDGERYWWARRNGNGYMNASKADDAQAIKAMEDARDVMRYLLLTDLAADGDPFRYFGRAQHGERTVSILRKKNSPTRSTSLYVCEDGSVASVMRIDTHVRPVDEDGNGQPDPGGQTETLVLEMRVIPQNIATVDGVKLPTRIEVQAGGRPWVTAVLEKDPAFKFPHADDVDDRVFQKPR